MRFLLTMICVLLMATPVLAETFTEDFEGGSNVGGWTFGNAADTIETEGGNPDSWFHNDYLDVWGVILRCDYGAEMFSGDYVEMNVTRISGDFMTVDGPDTTPYYPFTVLLRNDGGTPDDVEDDIYVYPNPDLLLCPQIDAGWTHYDFEIPSDFVGADGELPEGWMGGSYYSGGDWFPEDANWTDVMSNIARVEIWWFHPGWFGIFNWWDVGADNIEIEWTGGPVATENATFGDVKALYR